jgi:hypothetical protein
VDFADSAGADDSEIDGLIWHKIVEPASRRSSYYQNSLTGWFVRSVSFVAAQAECFSSWRQARRLAYS